jgi:hypothetical protein
MLGWHLVFAELGFGKLDLRIDVNLRGFKMLNRNSLDWIEFE